MDNRIDETADNLISGFLNIQTLAQGLEGHFDSIMAFLLLKDFKDLSESVGISFYNCESDVEREVRDTFVETLTYLREGIQGVIDKNTLNDDQQARLKTFVSSIEKEQNTLL